MATTLDYSPAPSSAPQGSGDADRQRMLVTAAYDILEEAGLEGLTVRAVLTRTGLARRAFYDCFGGKDDLVVAVFEQTLRDAARYFGGPGMEGLDPLGRIRLLVTGIVLGRIGLPAGQEGSTDRRSAALSREHLRLAEARPAELQAALSPLLDLIAGLVEEGIASGQIRPCDPALQARLIYNLVSTTVHTELLADETAHPDLERRRQLADDIWDFCRRAIAA